MDQNNKVHLVVGAAGMIGGALTEFLRASSEKVIAADLWREDPDEDKIFLNLASDPSKWDIPSSVKTAYICSGITKLDQCRRDPVGSSQVNVTGTLALIKTLIDKRIFVVFLSSNQVFDGSIPNVPAQQPRNPVNEYGRQKAAVENILSQWPEQAAIVRLSKVIGPGSIFSKWAQSLFAEQPIRPFTDMVVSPVPLTTVVSILRLIGDQKRGGIWQISGERDVTYSEAAFLGGKVLGVNLSLIRPWNMTEAGLELESNPANTTMDSERLRQDLGLEPPPVNWSVENFFFGEGGYNDKNP